MLESVLIKSSNLHPPDYKVNHYPNDLFHCNCILHYHTCSVAPCGKIILYVCQSVVR